ncbi:formin-binding protein 1-like [Tropilaelaps mercedesae]|uniref:Formin-binding protein 1-like n=1 Tax=Tropilaelaps mercedesae TaxID=418985 RepID=A0A1V9X705_9ACAR|nr:formin-binding protein 1-like [Tropilaelaps mercedesae]
MLRCSVTRYCALYAAFALHPRRCVRATLNLCGRFVVTASTPPTTMDADVTTVYATIPGGGGGYTGSSNGDHGAFNSESGVGSGSLRDIDDPDFDAPANDGEEEPLPLLGTAIALYTFEAENEGAISMNENDEMYIVELDQGDGWTRVRMQRDSEEGFVPSSYLSMTMYNTC